MKELLLRTAASLGGRAHKQVATLEADLSAAEGSAARAGDEARAAQAAVKQAAALAVEVATLRVTVRAAYEGPILLYLVVKAEEPVLSSCSSI